MAELKSPKDSLSNIRIEYSTEATVNIGDFQNVRPGFKVSADVADGSSPTEAKKLLVGLVNDWLEAEVASIREELNS